MKKYFKNVYLISFGTPEANGYIYDESLSQKIAQELWFSSCLGYTEDKGKTVTPIHNHIFTMVNLYAVVEDDVLVLRGDFELDVDKLSENEKKRFDNLFRIVLQTEDNEIEEKTIKSCKVQGYVVEYMEKI